MNPNIITAVSTGQDIWGLLAVILLYLLAIIFLMFLVHIVVAYFLYKDAQQHGMSGGLGNRGGVTAIPILRRHRGLSHRSAHSCMCVCDSEKPQSWIQESQKRRRLNESLPPLNYSEKSIRFMYAYCIHTSRIVVNATKKMLGC